MRWGALLLLLASGCAVSRGAVHTERVRAGGAVLELAVEAGAASDAGDVRDALRHALDEVTRRWGPLRAPARLEVLADHEALEEAVGKRGFPWLRAWARYDVVYLQAPSSWGLLGGTGGALRELLAHELTHVAMYQRGADAGTWQRKRIPLWFREGMASVTANQGPRRPGLRELARWMERHPDADPVLASDELYRTESAAVYAAAHHAFAFLEARYGAAAVGRVLDRMREAQHRFPQAFEEVIGIPLEAFEAEFRRFVRWEGWREVR